MPLASEKREGADGKRETDGGRFTLLRSTPRLTERCVPGRSPGSPLEEQCVLPSRGVPQWLTWNDCVAAYSCGGSSGIERALTGFPLRRTRVRNRSTTRYWVPRARVVNMLWLQPSTLRRTHRLRRWLARGHAGLRNVARRAWNQLLRPPGYLTV